MAKKGKAKATSKAMKTQPKKKPKSNYRLRKRKDNRHYRYKSDWKPKGGGWSSKWSAIKPVVVETSPGTMWMAAQSDLPYSTWDIVEDWKLWRREQALLWKPTLPIQNSKPAQLNATVVWNPHALMRLCKYTDNSKASV